MKINVLLQLGIGSAKCRKRAIAVTGGAVATKHISRLSVEVTVDDAQALSSNKRQCLAQCGLANASLSHQQHCLLMLQCPVIKSGKIIMVAK